MPQRGEGALKAGQCLAIGGALGGQDPGPVEMNDGSVPALALETMQTQSEVVGFQVIRVQDGQRISHAAVQCLAARRQKLAVGNFPDPLVGKVQLLSGAVEHASADELFHATSELILLETEGVLQ